MSEYLQLTVDKFNFKVAVDRLYTADGLWVKNDASTALIGLTDYFQQHNGDIAFVNLESIGSSRKAGDELATVETIKVNISLPSPVSGEVIKINEKAVSRPEIIHEDPYSAGWLCEMALNNWTEESTKLLSPDQYLAHIKKESEEELKKN